jgi:hypothetical protein
MAMSVEKMQTRGVRVLTTLIDVYAKKGVDYDAQINFTPRGAQLNIVPIAKAENKQDKYKLTKEEVDNLFTNLPSDPLL